MAARAGGPPSSKLLKGAGDKGGKLLRLLRSVGFDADLPPSTVDWLGTHPTFVWLVERLGQDNFNSAEAMALYEQHLQQEEDEQQYQHSIEEERLLDRAAAGVGSTPSSAKGAAISRASWLGEESLEELQAAAEVRGQLIPLADASNAAEQVGSLIHWH